MPWRGGSGDRHARAAAHRRRQRREGRQHAARRRAWRVGAVVGPHRRRRFLGGARRAAARAAAARACHRYRSDEGHPGTGRTRAAIVSTASAPRPTCSHGPSAPSPTPTRTCRSSGATHGYFADDDARRGRDDIAQSGADILFVAMTSPREGTLSRRVGPDAGRAGVSRCRRLVRRARGKGAAGA